MKLTDTMTISAGRATLRSYAKINFTLDVLSKRADGYHDIESVMQTVSLSDTVIVDRSRDMYIGSNAKFVPCNEKNTAWKAAEAFFAHTGIKGAARIYIQKNIPVAAGLAGGSSNAAATLAALNVLYNAFLSDEELCAIGAKIGADIPYCICGGTQVARGIGEILEPVASVPRMNIVLVKPPVPVSTAEIYSLIDSSELTVHPDTRAVVRAAQNGDISGIASNLCNVMENVTIQKLPKLAAVKQKMLDCGALGALMSGSGPTVFGIFPDLQTAKKCADEFAFLYKDTFLVQTV